MTPPRSSRCPAWLRRLLAGAGQESRRHSATRHGSFQWFRLGYITALQDVERTGLQPFTDKAMREAADRALGRWVETGRFQ